MRKIFYNRIFNLVFVADMFVYLLFLYLFQQLFFNSFEGNYLYASCVCCFLKTL